MGSIYFSAKFDQEKPCIMGAIKLNGIAKKGKLTVALPKEFDEKELEITIVTKELDTPNANESNEKDEKIERLMGIVGSAKFPDFYIAKDDVYDQ